MSQRSLPPVAPVETDEGAGARIMADLMCACGSRLWVAYAPGSDTDDTPPAAWCAKHASHIRFATSLRSEPA